MKKFLFLLLLLPAYSRADNKNEDRIYDFLNQVFSQWQKERKSSGATMIIYVSDKPDFSFFSGEELKADSVYNDIEVYTKIKSPFSKSDSVQIAKKKGDYNGFKFAQSKLTFAKLVSGDKIDEAFRSKGANGWEFLSKEMDIKDGYTTISVPIFFDNGRKAIFYNGYHCGGLCGGGQTSVFENVNGRWVETIVLARWVS